MNFQILVSRPNWACILRIVSVSIRKSASSFILGKVPEKLSKQIFAWSQNFKASVDPLRKPQSLLRPASGKAEHISVNMQQVNVTRVAMKSSIQTLCQGVIHAAVMDVVADDQIVFQAALDRVYEGYVLTITHDVNGLIKFPLVELATMTAKIHGIWMRFRA